MSGDAAYQAAIEDPAAQYTYAKAHCVLTPYLVFAEAYPSGWTYQHIILLTAGIGTLLCLLSSFALIVTHLFNWVKPAEQKQIVRIILFAPIFAIFNVFSVYSYRVSWILQPFSELYECFALVAVFYLMVLYVTPNEGSRESFFQHLQRLGRYTQKEKQGGSLQWYQVTWILVFQILPAKLVINAVVWILNAKMCPIAYTGSRASTAVSVIQSLVTIMCIMAIIGFYRRLKAEMQGHHALRKLATFKGFVGIVLLQTPIFTALAQHQVFDRTQYVSVIDFTVGTPSFMVSVEMFIVSLLFLWSFSAKEYKSIGRLQQLPRGSIGRALLDVINISDIIKGCWYMCRIIFGGGMAIEFETNATPTGKADNTYYGSNVDLRPLPPVSPAHHQQRQEYQPQRL